MPIEEEKRQEQFLLLLLALARASERKINDGVRRRLVTARKIRRLVQQMSPTGQFGSLSGAGSSRGAAAARGDHPHPALLPAP